MASVWNKIDSGLALIYANFLKVREHGPTVVRPHQVVERDLKLHVTLYYSGSLGPIEQVGFEIIRDYGAGRASGALRLEDLAAIAERNEVTSIHYGSKQEVQLDRSVPQIRANLVWTLGGPPNFAFTGNPGTDVIIGIIDTGADFRHPFLWLDSVPHPVTRILRIWDMGLTPTGAETSPDVALLEGGAGGTYGVEYSESQINDALQGISGALPIRHRDCKSHGTHVASIAGGDGRFAFRRIGVAPRANLVIVKVLELASDPAVGATSVDFPQMIKDAVTYIRKIADGPPVKPCVINYSIGSDVGPHDGLDDLSNWLNTEFRDANSAGRIFVAAAGNGAGRRKHATIQFTGAANIQIPFKGFDRRTSFREFGTCTGVDNTKDLIIDFFYPNGGPTLTGDLQPPGAAGFTNGNALGAGPSSGTMSGGRTFSIFNSEEPGHDGTTAIRRNNLRVVIDAPIPPTRHLAGSYIVRLNASAAMTVHAWCFQAKRAVPHGIQFDTTAMPPEVTVEDRFLISSNSCVPNVITVAAYKARVSSLDVSDFSSRGPVARHGAGGPIADKPDIGAPGEDVFAAKSSDIMPAQPGQTISLSGTSMAAPHVTGAIALMLEKNHTLTPSQVRTLLQANALTMPAPVPEQIGAGRLDAKNSFDSTP